MDLRERLLLAANSPRHPWELARCQVVESLLGARLDGARGLDFGCGDAWLVSRLCARHPGASFAAVDTELQDDDVGGPGVTTSRSVEQARRACPETRDLVLLLDVLEHIEDDLGVLRSLVDDPWMSGTFLLTTPAMPWLFTSHDEFLGHFRRHTRASLTRLAEQAGLRVEESGYFFASLVLPRLWQKLQEAVGIRHPQKGVAAWNRPYLTKLLTAVLYADFRLGRVVGGFIPGLSVYALCRKPA